MSEVNPNHPVTSTLHDHWHKVAAVVMLKQGLTEMEITEEDLAQLETALGSGGGVVADARNGRFVIRLMGRSEIEALARKEGGLPQ